MNKTLTINLGGLPFIIDEDAYRHLEVYLASIHKHFRRSEGYEEITGDIEARMAELFTEQLAGAPIVHAQLVENVIQIMGTPESFGADPASASAHGHTETADDSASYRPGKRLFRNTDEKVVAGICSGLAAYIGLKDPVWVRIVFVVLFFGTGIGLPAYIILWIVVPEAKTAADRLAMKGDPINVTTIGRQVEEELDNMKKMAEDLTEEVRMAFGSKK